MFKLLKAITPAIALAALLVVAITGCSGAAAKLPATATPLKPAALPTTAAQATATPLAALPTA